MVVQNQSELGKGSVMPTDPHHTPTIIESSTKPQKTQKPRNPKRKDTQVPQPSGLTEHVADEAVHKELGDSLVRAATTASSLEVEQDSGNITTTSGGGPRHQETIGDRIAQTRFENVSKLSNDSLLARDEYITLVNVQNDADNEMFDVNTKLVKKCLLLGKMTMLLKKSLMLLNVGDIGGKNENVVEEIVDAAQVSTTTTTVIITTEEVTLAQALADLKSTKPKAKGIAFREPDESTTTTTISLKGLLQDEGKGILIDEEERIARAKEENINEANIAWDEIQAKVDVDYQLAERLHAEEQEQFTIKEKATLFKELLEQRRKHFGAKRA
ncbi:hypothetical protein Tco_1184818 [Tanacetum coccineum]